MKEIKLHGKYANGSVALIDNDDYDAVKDYKWHVNPKGYILAYENRGGKYTWIYLHRRILEPPKGFVTDHINGNRLDNRKSNLRYCTRRQNGYNTGLRSNNTTGFKGISKIRNSFQARIFVNRKCISLGLYEKPEDAAVAYDRAAIQYFGSYAKTNSMIAKIM